MRNKQAVQCLIFVTAGLMLAVQAGLAAHLIDHVSQQVDVTCAICAFDGYAKAMPPLPDSVSAHAASYDTPTTKNSEPTKSVLAGQTRIRAPPRLC